MGINESLLNYEQQADEIERLAGKLKCSDAIARGATKALNTAAAELERLTGAVSGLRQNRDMANDRIEKLEAALGDLLEDTQHSEHDCGDHENCPVIHARALLEGDG